MTWQFVLISLTSVVSMGLASWILGQVLGMYPVETAIGAGMINNSMGGTGNIAVLSAADRMEMIAFAQMQPPRRRNCPHPRRNPYPIFTLIQQLLEKYSFLFFGKSEYFLDDIITM